MRIIYSLVLSTLFVFVLHAQTVWTGNVDTEWTNAGNWSAGVPTSGMTVTIPGTPQGGNFPVYSGSPVIDFTIQNAGAITFDDFVYNNGTIINFSNGTLVNNNNYFVNAGSVVFDNDGNFTNTGTFENFGVFDNAASASFSNETGASLINHGLFNNNGLLENHGSISNYGTVLSTNNLHNYGTIENSGLIDNPSGSTVNNAAGGVINNNTAESGFSHNGIFQNDGTINNSGVLTNQNSGQLTNEGNIVNDNTLQVSGTLLNNSTVTNNNLTIVNDAGTLDNKNNFANYGTIETTICGVIIQDSPINISASVLHDGIIYEIQGSVDETIVEFGVVYNNINDTKPPVAGCKSGATVQLDENGEGTLDILLVDKGSYASCGATVVSRTLSPNTFTIDDLGAQNVTLTIEDNLGVISTCDAVVFVVEYVAPIEPIDDPDIEFACPDDITATPEVGALTTTVSWEEPAAPTTNCVLQNECSGVTLVAWDLDACTSYSNDGSNLDYSEFTPVYPDGGGFDAVDASIIYRNSGEHSCSPPIEGSNGEAMCVPTKEECDFVDNDDYALRFEVTVTPDGEGNISFLRFYEKAPLEYNWIDGASGPNNYPTKYGIRVLKNGTEIFKQIDIPATQDWTEEVFDFSDDPDFTVTEQATFSFELRAYCRIQNGYPVSVWDIDNFSIEGCSGANPPNCDNVDEDIPGFIFMGEYNNSKYYCSNTSNWTWTEAKAEAEANGGSLAIVEDMEENDFLQNGIMADYAWIGLSDEEEEGTFKWVNGESLTFSNWNSGEPNNGGGVEDYVRLLKSNGKWTDRSPEFEAEFVMEISCSNAPPSCENAPEDIPGFTLIGEYNDAKYYTSNSSANWGNAKNNCEANGGHLVVINDEAENDFVQDNMTSGSFWIGLSTIGSPGYFNWVNGDPLNYTNWASGEPNGDGVNQAVRIKESSGEWTDRNADSYSYEYMMEIPCENTPPPVNDPVVEQISGPPNGGNFGVGVTEIAYQVTDDCGNLEICIFTVTVEENPAEITVDCPADITVDAAPGAGSANVSWTEPTGSSTCFDPGVEINRTDVGPENGDAFPVGVTFVSYAVIDSCGNFAQCLLTITVNGQAAVLTLESCPGDISTDTNNFNWNPPTASTTCYTGNVTIEQVDGPANGSNPGEGVFEIAYLINDDCGNSDVCVFYVTVESSCPAPGTACDDGDDCTEGDVEDGNCNCAGIYTDSDGDGVCDEEDICEGGDDTIDTDGDGIPDFCDDCSVVGQPCDDGDACTEGDIYDANCNCVGIYLDSDGDGVCDEEDICEGGDDNIDTDGDGIPDFCDDCSVVGQPCDDGDACTEGDIYDANCNCAGTYLDSDGDGVCDEEDICEGGDDNIDTDGDGIPDFCDEPGGNPCDDIVITIGAGNITVSNINAPIFNVYVFNSGWGTEFNCNYTCVDPTSIDLVSGTYYVKVSLRDADWQPICEIFETVVVTEGCSFPEGAPCNDGDACTSGDVYDANCNCIGTFQDGDGDGVCDADDVCPGFDDHVDTDGDGIPDGCDTNECDNITSPGEIAADETGCSGYDPALIYSVSPASGGSGAIEYLWLASTTGCPQDLSFAIPGANGSTYDPGPITETTYYRRCARRAGCTIWTGESNCVVKTVDDTDSDGDGVCDTDDICEGGDDNIDSDGDGIPDFCDEPGGDPCEDIVITISAGNITVSNINAPLFNVYVFNSGWGTEFNCSYTCIDPTSIDLDAGTYYVKVSLRDADWQPICEIFETVIVPEGCSFDEGAPCDDGDACTTGDVYDHDCNCAGTFEDSDNDGVCDADDVCPGYDDLQDSDGDGIPDSCDTNVCDNVTDGGEIEGGESGCAGYDPAEITNLWTPSGGSGPIEYLWLSSTSGCPSNLNQAIPGATSASYDPGPITTTTYFVRCSRRANCSSWSAGESNCVVKTVNTSDLDGDGVCDDEDICAGGDDTIDNDGDGIPNHCDDTPNGGGDPCEEVLVTPGDGTITISNIDAPIFTVMIFNAQWQTVYNCGYSCTDPAVATDLDEGNYHLSIKLYDEDWNFICQHTLDVYVANSSNFVGHGEEIFDFQAYKNGRKVKIYWMTNTEIRNDHFIVERSYDGVDFEPLLNVNSITDNPGGFNYTEIDENPAFGENFYRLKKVHKDGSSTYSANRRVVFDLDLSETVVFPNPASHEIYVDLQEFEGRSATIAIFNHLGQRMEVKVLDEIGSAPIRFDLSKYTGGAYTMYVDMEGTRNFAKKFIVSKL